MYEILAKIESPSQFYISYKTNISLHFKIEILRMFVTVLQKNIILNNFVN